MSNFDPALFLEMTLEDPTEKRPPLPINDYNATIGTVTARAWTGKADPTKRGIAWDIPLTVDIPAELQGSLGLPETLTMRDSIMLDLTDNGTIDNSPGKNRRLRAYRIAVDMNKPGDKFSAKALDGKLIKVKITHELWEGEIQERIGNVAPAA